MAKKIETKGSTARSRRQLAHHIEGLREPTITALGMPANKSLRAGDRREASLMRRVEDSLGETHGEQKALNEQGLIPISYLRNELPRELLTGTNLPDSLFLRLAGQSEKAMDSALQGQTIGRPIDNRARGVANILAHAFADLTGRTPTFITVSGTEKEGEIRGPFLKFVRDVFEILGIDHDPLSYASRAAHKLRIARGDERLGRKK